MTDDKKLVEAVLDAALDELDSLSDDEKVVESKTESKPAPPKPVTSNGRPVLGPERPPNSENMSRAEKMFTDMVENMLLTDQHVGDDDHGEEAQRKACEQMLQFMQQIESQIEIEAEETTSSEPTSSSSSVPSPPQPQSTSARASAAPQPPASRPNVDEAISKLIHDLEEQAKLNDDGENDDLLNGLDMDAMMDGMMEQLMSKDLMYEPMKEVASRFPRWLQEKKDSLSKEEYEQ
jgi:peroxin-19